MAEPLVPDTHTTRSCIVIITIAYGVSVTYFWTMVRLMKHGWGKHMWNVTLTELVEFNKALLPNTLTYLICPALTKIAILSVLYRINPSVTYRYLVVAVAIAIFIYTLALCIITGAPCNPLKSGTTKCLENVALSQAVLNIASDLAVIALPIPTIHNLHFSLKRRAMVGCLLALGSGVIICSIARLPYVIRLDKTPDTTYTEAILGVWSIAEINLAIICSCAMRLKRLVATYLPRLSLFSSRSHSAAGKTTYSSSVNRFRLDHSQHSYQLHSIQKGNAGPFSDSNGISIHRSFKVDVEGTDRHTGDGESADKILA